MLTWRYVHELKEGEHITAPLSFISPTENHRRYQIPSAGGAADPPVFYLGHRDGWLAAILRDSSVLLLNPLTSAASRLPSILTLQDDPFSDCVDKIVLAPSHDGNPPIAVVAYGHMLVDHLAFVPRKRKQSRGMRGVTGLRAREGKSRILGERGLLADLDLGLPDVSIWTICFKGRRRSSRR